MTLLLGGSLLLVAASAGALLKGWVDADETFIWGSIGATVLAGVLLGIAFFRSRSQATTAAAANPQQRGAPIDPEIMADREERSQQKYERASTRGEAEEDSGGGATQVLEGQPGGAGVAAGAAGAAAAPDAPTTATPTVGPPAGEPESGQVVAVPKTKKFHRPDCRFASAQETESLDRAAAVDRGFDPCGVCKP